MMKKTVNQIQTFTKTHEKLLFPLFLILGFVVDYLTLTRVDQVFDNIILFLYLTLASSMIFLIYLNNVNTSEVIKYKKFHEFSPLIFQYAIGGLFSGLFIFYFRSGSFGASFPFLIVLFALMLGNEYFYRRFPKMRFQLIVFFIALLSYVNLVLPVVIKKMGTLIFLIATTIASILMYFFVIGLFKTIHYIKNTILIDERDKVLKSLFVTLCLFLVFYFSNLIPPIPLSMKSGGIFHNVLRSSDNEFLVVRENVPWYLPFHNYDPNFKNDGNGVYAFASIFAPAKLSTKIYHQWSFYDEDKGWIEKERIPIEIYGGREEGFRGYSFKQNIQEGTWRVDIETERGQIIGRMRFDVENGIPEDLEQVNF
jgi:hypothetical protein